MRHRASRGFTLLELLIVLSITAAVVGGAALALPDSGRRALEQDAQRLAAQLEVARAQSRASGQAVWADVQAQGWRWQGLPSPADVAVAAAAGVATSDAMQQRWLHAPTQAAAVRVQLGPEPVIGAQQVSLWNDQGQRTLVVTDGVRPFEVVPQP